MTTWRAKAAEVFEAYNIRANFYVTPDWSYCESAVLWSCSGCPWIDECDVMNTEVD